MKSLSEEKEEEVTQEGESEPSQGSLNLFKPRGITNHELWQCIYYIAPTSEKKDWNSSEKIGIYCTKCKCTISTSVRNTKAHERHMKSVHQDLIDEFKNKKDKKRKSVSKISSFFAKDAKKIKSASHADQMHFNNLVALWTSCSLRSFSISEDKGLQDMINFATSIYGFLKLPSRMTNKRRIDELADKTRTKMKKLLSENCDYFSGTSDLWSSKSMDSFMAFTLHFLGKDFQRYNFTLAVKPTVGRHTGKMIKGYMVNVLEEWGLTKDKLVMMLRDSGSNMVNACKRWGVSHFPCIGHSLHLVVGPFLLEKKKNTNGSDVVKDEEEITIDEEVTIDEEAIIDEEVTVIENSDDVTDDAYGDDFTKEYNDNYALKQVREIVSKIRKIVKFIKNSTKNKELFENFQKNSTKDKELPENFQVNELREKVLQVSLDVRTRWNSTLKMLLRSLELKEPINQFLTYYATPIGQKEFKSLKTKLDKVTEKEWAIIHGVCHLLKSFDSATKFLSTEKHSSFVTAFPVLRYIKDKIGNEEMFGFAETSSDTQSKFKQEFYGQYGYEIFFESVVRVLNSCRLLLFNEFMTRFEEMKIEIMWSTLLDPRFSLKSKHWKDVTEKNLVKKLLMKRVENIAVQEASEKYNSRTLELKSIESDSGPENKDAIDVFVEQEKNSLENEIDDDIGLYGENETNVDHDLSEMTTIEKVKYQANQEVFMYLIATSICGIVDTAKRNRLNGKSIENQVFIHNNHNYI